MSKMINTLCKELPTELGKLAELGRTMSYRRDDTLALFAISLPNSQVEANSGWLEPLLNTALASCIWIHYTLVFTDPIQTVEEWHHAP